MSVHLSCAPNLALGASSWKKATWRQGIVDREGRQLRIEFEDFDEEQTLNLARENPNVLRSSEQESVADRAAAICSRVYLRVKERFEIIVKDRRPLDGWRFRRNCVRAYCNSRAPKDSLASFGHGQLQTRASTP